MRVRIRVRDEVGVMCGVLNEFGLLVGDGDEGGLRVEIVVEIRLAIIGIRLGLNYDLL